MSGDNDVLGKLAEDAKQRINYNSHNLGELGQFIRVPYAFSIIDDLVLKLRMVQEQD